MILNPFFSQVCKYVVRLLTKSRLIWNMQFSIWNPQTLILNNTLIRRTKVGFYCAVLSRHDWNFLSWNIFTFLFSSPCQLLAHLEKVVHIETFVDLKIGYFLLALQIARSSLLTLQSWPQCRRNRGFRWRGNSTPV